MAAELWGPLAKTLDLLSRRLDALAPEVPLPERGELVRLRRLTTATLQRLHELDAAVEDMRFGAPAGVQPGGRDSRRLRVVPPAMEAASGGGSR